MSEELYLLFVSPVNQDSAQKLVNMLAVASQQKAPMVHLVIQSFGGTVGDGIFLHNFLKSYPVDLLAYNIGSISSAAVTMYLGAKTRITSPVANFMIHPTHTTQNSVTATRLDSLADSIRAEDVRTEAILKEHLKLSKEQWSKHASQELWITAQDAVASGLAHKEGVFSPKPGAMIYSI